MAVSCAITTESQYPHLSSGNEATCLVYFAGPRGSRNGSPTSYPDLEMLPWPWALIREIQKGCGG